MVHAFYFITQIFHYIMCEFIEKMVYAYTNLIYIPNGPATN